MVKWIETNGIMEMLFGSNAHQQLLRKSSDVVQFMATRQSLTQTHLETMWNTALVLLHLILCIIFGRGRMSQKLQL